MIIAVLFAAAMAASDPAAPAPAPAAPVAAAADANKVVCHNEEVTGSRLGNVRVCMTRAQWDERSANDRANFQTTLTSANTTGPH